MSFNKNLSIFARNLIANGNIDSSDLVITAKQFLTANGSPVGIEPGATYSINITGSADTVDGLEATDLVSNTFFQSDQEAANTWIKGTFASNTWINGTFASNTWVKGTFASNTWINGTFASNTYAQDGFLKTNADSTLSATISGTGSINVSGTITGPTTDTLLVKDSSGATLKTIRGV